MKIAIDLTTLADNFSGIERYALNISLNLIKHKEHNFVLIFKEKVFPEFDNIPHDNFECVVLKRNHKLLFNLFRLPKALKKIKADCYLFLAFPPPLFFKRRRIISTIHDLCCWDYPETMTFGSRWYFRVCFKSAVKKSKKIITVSEFSKERIKDKYDCPSDKIAVCYSGLSESFLNFSKNPDCNVFDKYNLPQKYILSLSTIEPRKNLRLLLDAYSSLMQEDNQIIDLVLAGRRGWKEDNLLKGIDEKVKAKLHFTGFIEDKDLPKIYSCAECFVFPSKYEGFGLPPLEAMACGTIVLSSQTASMPEILSDKVFYFTSNDVDSLKENLKRIFLLSDLEKDKLIRDGFNHVKSFEWQSSSDKILNLLINL